jgi:signal peptidase I
MRQRYLKYIIGIASFFLICWGVLSFTQLHENVSNSLEGIRYILFLKTGANGFIASPTIERGDIVSIQGYEPAYVGTKSFAKRVLGLPGDLILKDKKKITIVSKIFVPRALVSETPMSETTASETTASEIFTFKNSMSKAIVPIASKTVTLPLLEKTSEGKPLTPLLATSVPEGYVFVAGDNPNSFDSRYEEFGLVPREKIWGKAIVVFSTQYPVLRFYPFQEQKNEDKE